MSTLVELKIRRLTPYCWGTFALVQIAEEPHQLAVYSFSSTSFPTGDEVTQITQRGKRLPLVVAAHYFPEVMPRPVPVPLACVLPTIQAA